MIPSGLTSVPLNLHTEVQVLILDYNQVQFKIKVVIMTLMMVNQSLHSLQSQMIVVLTIITVSLTICKIIVILIIPQISRLGENVFITKLPNLQKISLRHCGIKVLNILNEEIMTCDKYDKYEKESKGRRENTHSLRLFI